MHSPASSSSICRAISYWLFESPFSVRFPCKLRNEVRSRNKLFMRNEKTRTIHTQTLGSLFLLWWVLRVVWRDLLRKQTDYPECTTGRQIKLPSKFHLRRWFSGRAHRAISSNLIRLRCTPLPNWFESVKFHVNVWLCDFYVQTMNFSVAKVIQSAIFA